MTLPSVAVVVFVLLVYHSYQSLGVYFVSVRSQITVYDVCSFVSQVPRRC